MTGESEATSGGERSGVHEDIEALLSDYVEGGLTSAEHQRVEAHLAGCGSCRAAHQELRETMDALSGLHKQPAPPDLTAGVTKTIHRRSGGRFFGRRAFGDRVPFELLAIVALVVAVGLYLVLRSSNTGSLRYEGQPDTPKIAPGAREAVPLP